MKAESNSNLTTECTPEIALAILELDLLRTQKAIAALRKECAKVIVFENRHPQVISQISLAEIVEIRRQLACLNDEYERLCATGAIPGAIHEQRRQALQAQLDEKLSQVAFDLRHGVPIEEGGPHEASFQTKLVIR